ncbi:hypothetical protein, partial [Endozoicomonas sp. SESOKO1]|uniref:hypothetical protein n=1 Tax=Endozoicomonas sp. SESOKO1 TaxID=2828742 RepID=UPI0021481FF8
IKHCLKTQTVSVNESLATKVVYSTLYDSPWYGGFTLVRRALLEEGLLLKLLREAPLMKSMKSMKSMKNS